MATSICPKCENTSFEMVEAPRIKGSNYKQMFIQCDRCGAVVGTTDYHNVPALIYELAKKLRINLD